MKQDMHVASLAEKHVAVDRTLAEVMSRPSSSDAEIAALKKRKLHLKDRIATVRSANRATH